MGLDMYAFTTSQKIPKVNFKHPEDAAELFYWRKHPNLHGWMEQLYQKKRGLFCLPREFNLAPVRLDEVDLNALRTAISHDALPHTNGFFFGQSRPEDQIKDLEFIELAQQAIASGKFVFYTSWW